MRLADFALAWWWFGDMTPVADLHGYRGVRSVVHMCGFDERHGGVQGWMVRTVSLDSDRTGDIDLLNRSRTVFCWMSSTRTIVAWIHGRLSAHNQTHMLREKDSNY